MKGVQLRPVSLTDPLVQPLINGLTQEYERRYGVNDEMAAYEPASFDPPGGYFVVLERGGRTAAGGGFRRLDQRTAEIKRMWTDPDQRRRGHGRRVLASLEDEASRQGFARLRLETGTAQPEAIALYASAGYVQIPGYGRYQDSPDSLSFEKALPQGPAGPARR
ncbi:MAG: GNAT family N-acetyltransferase [Candidatus Dormibacteria bacterium]